MKVIFKMLLKILIIGSFIILGATTPRDINALKMKLKNIKAQSKKTKLEFVDTEDANEESDNDQYEDNADGEGSATDFKFILNGRRKRCKKFSKGDCDLLIELYEKYCTNLDSSSSAVSVKRRNDAWECLTNEFNHRQTNGIHRDQAELKIKIKNLKASRVKTEPNDTASVFETSSVEANVEASTPVLKTIIHNRSLAQTNQQRQDTPLRIVASHGSNPNVRRHEDHAPASTGDGFYDEFEVEYIQQPPKAQSSSNATSSNDSKEIERIRKENLLIKNSVLKKKERLLELQIALAERNLRRQI